MSVIETRVSHKGPFEVIKELNLPLPGEMAITVTRIVNGVPKMCTARISEELLSEAVNHWKLGDNVAQYLMAKLNYAEGIS